MTLDVLQEILHTFLPIVIAEKKGNLLQLTEKKEWLKKPKRNVRD